MNENSGVAAYQSLAQMNSFEIATLVEKRHDNVKRTIESLAEAGVIQLPKIEEVKREQLLSPNNKSSVYVFTGEIGKRDSIVVVARLSPEFTARIIDRWLELERKSEESDILHNLESPDFLRGLLLEYTERTIQAENQLKEQAPKVKFYDTVTTTEDTADMSQVAKIINRKGYGRNKLFALLREHRVLRKNNEPYQKYVDAGWFRLIESTWIDNDGERHIYFKTVVFQRGIEGIIDIINSDEKLELEKF